MTLRRIFCGYIGLMLASACFVVHAEGFMDTVRKLAAVNVPSRFPITNAPAQYRGGRIWLDNERLVLYIDKSAGPEDPKVGTYSWNVKTGAINYLSEWRLDCFNGETARWRLLSSKDEPIRWKIGQLGQEVELLPPRYLTQEEASLDGKLNCKINRKNDLIPPPVMHHRIVVLYDGDGYLDLDADISSSNLRLYSPNGHVTTLPIEMSEGVQAIEYSRFRKAYILAPTRIRGAKSNGGWPKGVPLVAYILSSDRIIETVSVPYVEGNLGSVQPVRSGFLWGGGNFYKSLGLYYFDGKAASKIDDGILYPGNINVSPDGCKAAVLITNDHLKKSSRNNLKVFDFCSGTNQH